MQHPKTDITLTSSDVAAFQPFSEESKLRQKNKSVNAYLIALTGTVHRNRNLIIVPLGCNYVAGCSLLKYRLPFTRNLFCIISNLQFGSSYYLQNLYESPAD